MSKKINIRKLILLISIPLIIIGIYFFIAKNNPNEVCKDVNIKINFKTKMPMINESDIYKSISINDKSKLIGKTASQLNINEMEKNLVLNPKIKKAQIYLSLTGTLNIEVMQRNPLFRVNPDGKTPYYICDDGVKISRSTLYTPYLVPVSGFVNDKIDRKLSFVVGFVNNNSFWKDQIQQFFVDEKQVISFIPTTGVHEVVIGDTSNLATKFKKLEIFYKYGLNKMGWDKYKTIDIRYKGQVICKK